MSPVKTVHVVAAVIKDRGHVLCVQRGEHKYDYISKKWEFPGGKVEAGEKPPDALKREILEELHLAIDVDSFFQTVDHTYADFHVRMDSYLCSLSNGVDRSAIQLTEHISHLWLSSSSAEFKSLSWAAADIPIVDGLITQAV